jgi:PPOX class probable F420-dependent enzyme
VPASPLTAEQTLFVERARRAHLATAARDGTPHVVPVCFALLDGATVVFAVDDKPKAPGRKLKRLRNLEDNPRFALVIDRWDEDWSRLGWVMLSGRGHVLRDAARRAAAVRELRGRYPQYVAMGLDPERHVIVALAVDRVRAWGDLA